MPDPLDLDAIRAQVNARDSSSLLWSSREVAEMLAVIAALREALAAVPDFPHVYLCNDNPCRCFVGKRHAALALVTGEKDD